MNKLMKLLQKEYELTNNGRYREMIECLIKSKTLYIAHTEHLLTEPMWNCLNKAKRVKKQSRGSIYDFNKDEVFDVSFNVSANLVTWDKF